MTMNNTNIKYYEQDGIEMVNVNGRVKTKEQFMDEYQAVFTNQRITKDKVENIIESSNEKAA